jgi:hypothetical protein
MERQRRQKHLPIDMLCILTRFQRSKLVFGPKPKRQSCPNSELGAWRPVRSGAVNCGLFATFPALCFQDLSRLFLVAHVRSHVRFLLHLAFFRQRVVYASNLCDMLKFYVSISEPFHCDLCPICLSCASWPFWWEEPSQMLLRKTWWLESGAEICPNYIYINSAWKNERSGTTFGQILKSLLALGSKQSPFIASKVKVRLHGCEAVGRDGMGRVVSSWTI